MAPISQVVDIRILHRSQRLEEEVQPATYDAQGRLRLGGTRVGAVLDVTA